MPNDIKKLRRLMSASNYLRHAEITILRGRKADASTALRFAWWFESFRKDLATGVFRFSYFKVDGGIRQARGTLDFARIPVEQRPKAIRPDDYEECAQNTVFCYYDLDARGWRSFRLDNFIGFVDKEE